MFNALDIPIYFYLITFGIGLIIGFLRKDWVIGAIAAYLFFVFVETVLIRKAGVSADFRPELFWSWKVPDLRAQIYSNVLMFVPFGMLIGLKISWKSIPAAAGCSLIVEMIQLLSHRGVFEFDDVIHNTIGAVIGFLILVAIKKLTIGLVRKS